MKTVYNKDYYNLEKEKVGVLVTSKEEFSKREKDLLEKAQLGNKYNYEAWSALGTNTDLAYFTHGIFRFFGKFPPVIATQLLKQYSKEEDLVLDIMCGSGTTGVEGLALKRNVVLNDINPLSILLAKVKTTPLKENDILRELEIIKKNYKPLTLKEYNFEPIGLRDYKHWFLDSTCDSLRGLKKNIEMIKNQDLKDFFYVCFLGIIRTVSKATTQQGRLFLDVKTAQEDAKEEFLKRVKKNMQAVCSLPNSGKLTIISKNVLTEKFKDYQNKVSLVIMHPPYFNSYKYSAINSLELAWLGIKPADIRKFEIREFFKVGKKENVTKYLEDIKEAINKARDCLKKDGILALMIGDTLIKGEYIPVCKMLLEQIEEKDLRVQKIILRIPKYTEASWAASQRRDASSVGINLCDFLIIFKKVN